MGRGGDVPGVDTPLLPHDHTTLQPNRSYLWDRLVVAGGRHVDDLATVEVLNTTSHQWLSASPLRVGCSSMISAIVNQELFLLGETLTTVSLLSLPDITQSSVVSAIANRSAQWRTLPAPPLTKSAAISLRGSVLAIGGNHGNMHSTAINLCLPACHKQLEQGWRLTFSTIILFINTVIQ